MKKLLPLILLLGTLLAPADITVPRTSQPPILDGKLALGEWSRINAPFSTIVKLAKPSCQTGLFMLYDDEFLYTALTFDEKIVADTPDREIFSSPRFEVRLGQEQDISLFVASLDKRKFPAMGWDCHWGDQCLEMRIPLAAIPGFRLFTGNIIRAGATENSSLFPIRELNFVTPVFHQKFFLGTPQEIQRDRANAEIAAKSAQAEAEKFTSQFASLPKPEILGENAKKFSTSQNWFPAKFETGKDFYFMFIPRYSPELGFFVPGVPGLENTLPLFRDAAYQIHTWDLNQGFRDKRQPIKKLLDASEKSFAGYILKKTDSPFMFKTDGRYHTFEKEIQELPETRAEFIQKYGHRLLCLDENESVGPNGGFPMIMKLAGLQPKNKKEAYEALRQVAFNPAQTFIRDWAVFYPELAPWRGPVSATFTDHPFLSFGFCMGGMECGPKTLNMPFSYAVTRGAARQYQQPFRTYLTTHDDKIIFPGWEGSSRHYTFNDYRLAKRPQTRRHSSSEKSGGTIFSVNGPQYGIPHADWRRCFIYSYMTGANIFFDECGHNIMYARYDYKTIEQEDPLAVNLREDKWHLSVMGQMMADFYDNIVCREDRGCAFTPIAMLWNLYHGHFTNYHTTPWGLFPETEGDQMMSAVENTLYPTSEKTHYNRGFRTSKFGDSFDVITHDATAQTLEGYPILFLCGDIPIDQKLARKLADYAYRGGTLIANWKQVETVQNLFPEGFFGATVAAERRQARSSFSRLTGKTLHERLDFRYNLAKPLSQAEVAVFTADQNQDPLVLVTPHGQGKVILTLPDFLKERYSRSQMLNIFTDLMHELCRQALPIQIEGDIQFQVHRNRKGWLVALYNNYGSGLNNTWQEPQQATNPKYDETVTLTPKIKYSAVREWFTGERNLQLNVPAGDVRIVEIIP